MTTYLELLRRNLWLGVLIGVILGLLVGLLIGWIIAPVSWAPGSDDVAAVADSYYVNGDPNLAARRLSGLSKDQLANILNARIKDAASNNRTLEERNLRNLATALNVPLGATPAGTPPVGPTSAARPGATPAPTSPASANNLVGILLIVLVIILIAAAGAIFYLRVLPNMRASRPARAATSVATTAPTTTVRTSEPAPRAPAPTAPAVTAPVTAPTTTAGGLGRFVPSYTLGNDNYDTSFSLETPRGEFLGECGMGISETVGDGKPDKVTAFDLWLFDKADVRTVTQILMTEYAYKDPTLRTKLATKGEAILAEKGKTLRLETQSLRLDAQIVELVYATNANYPPNSHFQKLIVEIVPSMKDGAAARG